MVNNSTDNADVPSGSSLSQFFTTFFVYGTITLVKIIIFILIRTKLQRIYEPKTYIGNEDQRMKPLSRTFYGWFIDLIRIPQKDLITKCGYDSYFFARYIYIHAVFFLCSFVLLGLILFPIYIIDGQGASHNKTGLDVLTFGNISPELTSRYAAPLVLAYVFIGSFLYLLYREIKDFVRTRQLLLRSLSVKSMSITRTILVTGIPKDYMSIDILLEIFNQYPGGVKHIELNRNIKKILRKERRRTKFINKLEKIECKIIRNSLKNINSGEKTARINFYREKISQLNNEIEEAKTSLNDYPLINSAFIEFNQMIGAHMAVQSVISAFPLGMTSRYLVINRTNIIWSNLKISYFEQKFRQIIVLIIISTLFFFWTFPVAFIGLLSNADYLTNKIKFLEFIHRTPMFIRGYLTGLLPSFLLSHLTSLLIKILSFLAKLTRIPTKDAIDRFVQNWFFLFQIVHVFLIVTISSSLASVIALIIENPTSTAKILATNIPTSSNFFLSFLIVKGFNIVSRALLQLTSVIRYYLYRKLFDNTPRKIYKRYSSLPSLNLVSIYPVLTNFVVITVVYSIIAPLILLIAGFVFTLIYIAFKYKMFYVVQFSNDVGGLSFSRAIFQSFMGIYLMEIMLAGLFFLVQDQSGSQAALPQAILMCILIAITLGVQLLIQSSFHSLTYYLPADSEVFHRMFDSDNDMTIDTKMIDESNSYIHPVLCQSKPIIWIANDSKGIADNVIQQNHASEFNIRMTNESAHFNDKFEIVIEGTFPHA